MSKLERTDAENQAIIDEFHGVTRVKFIDSVDPWGLSIKAMLGIIGVAGLFLVVILAGA